MDEDKRGGAIGGIPKLRCLVVLEYYLGVPWGFPWHPKIFKDSQKPKLGDAPKASPLSSSFIGNFTWSYIFIRHMICVLLGASCII